MEPAAKLTEGRGFTLKHEGQRGIALVAVLWIFILLSLIAASVASTTRTELRIARNGVSAGIAEAAADAAIMRAVVVLVAQRGRSAEWRTDGTPRSLKIGEVDVTVTIQDEGGRIDLNAASRDLLEIALRPLGPTGIALAAAIVDWRDGNDFVTPDGAEDGTYAGRGYPYGAKDAPFDSVDELRQVMGVTPQLYERIAPLFTVYSNSPGIDPAVAPREVLLALPQFDPGVVDTLLSARGNAAAAGGLATASPPPTVLTGSFAESQRNTFTITAVARGKEGTAFVREAAVFLPRNTRVPYLFLSWRQGRLANSANKSAQ